MLYAAIFVPDFPVEAVVRVEPALREQAVAVVEGTPPMLRVVAANEKARRAGVEPGMTNLQAAGRLLSLEIRHRSLASEAAAHAALADCAHAFSPRVEEHEAGPDTVVLDLAGLERLFGPPQKIARDLARRACELGLEANVAVAAKAEAAIHAARGFSGVTIIPVGKEAERLGPLPVEVLIFADINCDESTGTELLQTLDRWGVRTFRALAALPEVAVAERLGKAGVRWQKLARGEGSHTLVPVEAPLKFEEAMELEYPVSDLESLGFVLNRLLENLCARLAARALSTNELRVLLELDSCESEIQSSPQRHSNTAEISHRTTAVERILRLPVPMLDAKTFLKLVQLELKAQPPGAPVLKVCVEAEPVQPRYAQGGLFLPSAPEPERLELTLARIAAVVRSSGGNGEKQVPRFVRNDTLYDDSKEIANEELRVGSPELLDTHRPDAFRMRRFTPPQGETFHGRKNPQSDRSRNKTITALRLFRPPKQASVELRDSRPFRISVTEAIQGNVTWTAGPWLISGEWWNREPWSREVWDVAVAEEKGMVLYRLFRDAIRNAWFVEGTYD